MGLDAAQIADLCEIIEEGFARPVEISKAALRTRKWREKTETVTGDVTVTSQEIAEKPSPIVTVTSPVTPLARGEDNLPRLVDTGLAAAVDASADDWPAGDAGEHAKLLCAAAESYRLDPNREPGLVTSRGRLAAWRRDGASWQFDVVPTVTEIVRKRGPPIHVWTYFDGAIGQSIANNRKALEIPAHASPRPPASAKYAARQANMERALAGAESAAGGRDHATG